MTFAEKLKGYRKQAGLSQEKLAEKLMVSRQAITKWETGSGTPDIENMIAISELFGVSLDDLLSGEKTEKISKDYLFESVTEYDIDAVKSYDIKLGGANKVKLNAYDGEKIIVRLLSNTISTLQSDFKVKIDDIKNRIDVEMKRFGDMTEAIAKDALSVVIAIPQKYMGKVEVKVNTRKFEVSGIQCEDIEFDGKTDAVLISESKGELELNCNIDMLVTVKSYEGAIEINQLSSTSRIIVPEDYRFSAARKGIGTRLSYERNGKGVEDFSTDDADNYIELNGVKSELVICTEAV